jgi:hypothetical protein
LGGNWKLGERVNFRLGMSMHFTMTDLVDNVTGESPGNRAGTKGNDKFLYTNFALTYDLKKLTIGGKSNKDGVLDDEWYDLMAQDTMDYDLDGVPDLVDNCAKTPSHYRPVDQFGCPYDADKDGVADVMDLEKETPEKVSVDTSGVAFDDEDFFLMYRMYMDSIGEFAVLEDVVSTTSSEGGLLAGGNRNNQGIVNNAEQKKYTVIIGSDEIGVKPEDLHKYLSNKDFRTIDDGTTVKYVIGEYNNLSDAIAAQKELEKQGFTPTYVGEQTLNDKGKLTVNKVSQDEIDKAAISENTYTTLTETVYKIQIGAFKKKLSGNVFKDLPDVAYVKGEDGMYRYYSGSFSDKNKAAQHRIDVLTKGYTGSFIVAFKEGSRITLAQAGYEVNPTYKDVKVESSVPTANAIDKSLIKFKVQVGAYQNKIPTNVLDLYLSIGNVIPKKDPETGLTKYFVGTFNTYEEAVKFKQTLIDKGLVDAFVIGDFNGKIITATEALDLIK